jgi:hypothetical protein
MLFLAPRAGLEFRRWRNLGGSLDLSNPAIAGLTAAPMFFKESSYSPYLNLGFMIKCITA